MSLQNVLNYYQEIKPKLSEKSIKWLEQYYNVVVTAQYMLDNKKILTIKQLKEVAGVLKDMRDMHPKLAHDFKHYYQVTICEEEEEDLAQSLWALYEKEIQNFELDVQLELLGTDNKEILKQIFAFTEARELFETHLDTSMPPNTCPMIDDAISMVDLYAQEFGCDNKKYKSHMEDLRSACADLRSEISGDLKELWQESELSFSTNKIILKFPEELYGRTLLDLAVFNKQYQEIVEELKQEILIKDNEADFNGLDQMDEYVKNACENYQRLIIWGEAVAVNRKQGLHEFDIITII